ncbi:terpene synthase family protein [Nocardia sp. NPDC003963]
MTTTITRTRYGGGNAHVGGGIELGMRSTPHTRSEISASRDRVQQWVLDRNLAPTPDSFAWYQMWNTAGFVGASYPDASTAGMDLVGRFMAVSIMLDDALDELESASDCAQRVRPFLDIVRAAGVVAGPNVQPLHRAFGEVIRECRSRASVSWWRRTAQHWEASLIAIVHEVADRGMRGGPAPRDIHMSIRRDGGWMHPFLDIIEPAAGFELPELAFRSPQITVMRECIVQIGNLINDLHSLPKEIARGQHSNLILVIDAETGGPIGRSQRTVLDIITSHARRFHDLRTELPAVCDCLGFSASDRASTLRYADALELWAGGYEPWHRTSPRYRHALIARPPIVEARACEGLFDDHITEVPQ